MAAEPLTSTEFKRELDARDERLRTDMDARDERLRTDMDSREERLHQEMDAREARLKRYYDIQTEKLRDEIRKLSDGYIAGFERLERKLDNTQRDWAARFELHDDVLKNHAARISALETPERS